MSNTTARPSMQAWLIAPLAMGLWLMLGGCLEKPKFSFIPEISLDFVRDSSYIDALRLTPVDTILIQINFRDGDGDLGLANEWLPVSNRPDNRRDDSFYEPMDSPFNTNINGVYNPMSRNFRIEVLSRQPNGTFTTLFPDDVPTTFSQRFGKLFREGSRNPIEGKLRVGFSLSQLDVPTPNTVIKLRMRIQDRAQNYSNTIESDNITVQKR